jgi:succinyl-diaminopimelate desuccinylase
VTALSQVLRKIDADEVVELTRALVRIPSVYRPGDPEATEARMAAFVEAWLRREGFEVEVQPVAPGRPNIIGWLGEKRAGCRSLLLEGHTDVVTEGDPAEWSHPPFGADMVDGRIYGRGTADMKSGLAAAMVAAAAFKRAGVALRGKLVVGALVDEEDGMIGVRHLCGTAVGRELDAAIICEPEENELCLEQRGVVWARFRVRGKMAHGAMPQAGINPIAGLGRLLAAAPGLERRWRPARRPYCAADGDADGRPGPARVGVPRRTSSRRWPSWCWTCGLTRASTPMVSTPSSKRCAARLKAHVRVQRWSGRPSTPSGSPPGSTSPRGWCRR